MSNYQKRDGDVSLFANKNATPNSPYWKGKALINGEEYTISLWKRTGQSSGEYLNGRIERKLQGQSQPSPNSAEYYAGKPKAESHNNLNIQDNGSDLPF